MSIKPEIEERIKLLEEKFASMGQDLSSYLDGLLYADYLTYWDYIHLDTLLSLQNPKTSFPDEEIFIMYHQITELYFKLSLHELKQIAEHKNLNGEFFLARLKRINSYFGSLTRSFEIMVQGMDKEQFLKFRMSLLPASGFQSAQYRMIEICATDFSNLVDKDARDSVKDKARQKESIPDLFEHIYWKKGATELATGKKTLTLKQFEQKYAKQLIELANWAWDKNLWKSYLSLTEKDRQNPEIILALKEFDTNVNVTWPLMHYKSAVRYLQKDPEDIAATGGTNWQKYLPPRFQRRIFYPELWSEEELANWGKAMPN
jgi:tryptophan 2,3-dioxygenase